MTAVEWVTRLIGMGHFDFFGMGTNLPDAQRALDAAARIDYGSDDKEPS